MKIAILHSAALGFFPRIYNALRNSIIASGSSCMLFLPNNKSNRNSTLSDKCIYGSRANIVIHRTLYKITGLQDIFSFIGTLALIKKLKVYQPDVIHCHIINDKYLNLRVFVKFLNKSNIPLVWTMHDCRAITGRCAYFDEIGCDKWKNGCGNCPQKVLYEPTVIDNSHIEWIIKRKILSSINNITIVTPSQWLANIMSISLLNGKNCVVINNGVDLDAFQNNSDYIFDGHYLSGKYMVLGIASAWEDRKGLSVFKRLAEDLPEEFKIVLVGTLPYAINNVTSIPRTDSISELTAIYKRADIFVNPTMADNFPTTNIESLAAGTPVVTYNSGGSGEAISPECGIVVERGDYDALKNAVIKVATHKDQFTRQACLNRAQLYSSKRYNEYCQLYKKVIANRNRLFIPAFSLRRET